MIAYMELCIPKNRLLNSAHIQKYKLKNFQLEMKTRCGRKTSTLPILIKVGETTLKGMLYRYPGFIL